jgi:hypothetical protein
MTEKQALSFKPEPRPEHVGDERSERVQDRKHQTKMTRRFCLTTRIYAE